MKTWDTQIKTIRHFPTEDIVGYRLRREAMAHINGYGLDVIDPELTPLNNMLLYRESFTAEQLITLRIKVQQAQQVKQKELKDMDVALSFPDYKTCGFAVGFKKAMERVEEVFDDLFEEPALQEAI